MEIDMTKLIIAFQKNPTLFARKNLESYLVRHPMAVCMASDIELRFLRQHGFI
jgi:hypothetical protein